MVITIIQSYLIVGLFFAFIGGWQYVKHYQKHHPELNKNQYHTFKDIAFISAKLGMIFMIAGLIIDILWPLWLIEGIINKKKGKNL